MMRLPWSMIPHTTAVGDLAELGRPEHRGYLSSLLSGSLSSPMMCSAIAMEAVAAGDGALRTEVTGPTRLIRKSSTSAPSESTAWARTPAGALVTSASVIHGR